MSYAYHAEVFSLEGWMRGEHYLPTFADAVLWAEQVGFPGDLSKIHLAYECADGFEDYELEDQFLIREQ